MRPDVRPFCAVGSLAEPIEGEYDLITCIEVLEHMPEAEGIRAIANMTAVTDRIVFSSSPTDLVEPTHVNLKPAIYWLHLFAAHGFAPLVSVMLPSITPYALAFERSKTAVVSGTFLACAELVRLRLQIAALNGVVQDRDRSIAEANTQLATRNETVDRLGRGLAQHCCVGRLHCRTSSLSASGRSPPRSAPSPRPATSWTSGPASTTRRPGS